ncbi:MAG: DUF1223 domain-containing protein [Burkholderiales bacterium]
MIRFLFPGLSALILIAFAGSSAAQAPNCSAVSGSSTVALLELYTSEGCDSCPPADRWVGELGKRGFGSDRIVPIALHVDYWDYLGWKDPYARAAFTARQREVVKLGGGSVVYTPQILVNGRDYRRWSSASSFAGDLKAINDRPARATIALSLKPGGQSTAEVTAAVTNIDPLHRADAALFVALYEDGLSTNVTAGENKGVRLKHDRVVREWFGPFGLDGGGKIDLHRAVMLPARSRISGVVAFVQNRRNAEILQALDVPACSI